MSPTQIGKVKQGTLVKINVLFVFLMEGGDRGVLRCIGGGGGGGGVQRPCSGGFFWVERF